jgi:hypothetical protein
MDYRNLANFLLIVLLIVVAGVGGVMTMFLGFYTSPGIVNVITAAWVFQAACLVTGIVIVVRRRPSWWGIGYVGLLLFILATPFVAEGLYRSF